MKQTQKYRFNLEELAGSVGDYGTLIPIMVGVVAVTDLKLTPILLFFGIIYIATGLYYKLPMPVEPMKAIGAIAIAGKLSSNEICRSRYHNRLVIHSDRLKWHYDIH